MFEVSLGFLFRGFNACKFVTYLSLLFFVLLLSLKLDNKIGVGYAIVFLPIWIYNFLIFAGAVIGVASFLSRPPSQNDITLRVDFTAMQLTTVEHSFLFLFALMTYCKVDWSWAVVFIPLWVVLSLSAVGVLYALVLSIVLARSRHLVPSHRRQHVTSALFHACLVVPALICMVLLTGKLDALEWGDNDPAADMPFTAVFAPLLVSLLCLVLMSCVHGGGNVWWFGLRQPFCTALLDACPCLKQYANEIWDMLSFYDILQVSPDSSAEELKRAYFDYLRRIHPDKGAESEGSSDSVTFATHIWSILKPFQIEKIVDTGVFECGSCSLCLEVVKSSVQET
ncbi:DnaJ domain protein [Ancylostoma ceylanicum]|uniref:DnaJ domain protein n=1 Tax=Ancylostoma ceylanicum TaxID=53326 RepID=A0A0D6M3Q8_9BILA|nr:DnaJ domain protein [Ancylostoma ceylanicum]